MNKYHERFLRSFAAGSIIELFCRYKGSPKEVTESWGMLEAAKNHFPNLDQYKVVVVGDGNSPRTGALFSYFTKANVTSLDPAMNMVHYSWWHDRQVKLGETPQRLEVLKCKSQDVQINCLGKHLLVIWPHSHAPMNSLRVEGFTSRSDIALPCCVPVPKNWTRIEHICYEDFDIASPQRIVRIWKDHEICKSSSVSQAIG